MKEYLFTKAGNGKITVILSDDYLEIKRRGLLNKVLMGKDKQIEYKDITELKWRDTGLLINGSIELVCHEGNNSAGGKLENTIHFKSKKEREMAIEIKELLDNKISSKKMDADVVVSNCEE